MSAKIDKLNHEIAVKLFDGKEDNYVSHPGDVIMAAYRRFSNSTEIKDYSINIKNDIIKVSIDLKINISNWYGAGSHLYRYTRLSKEAYGYQVCYVINKLLDEWMKIKLEALL